MQPDKEMTIPYYESMLAARDIRPTANRLLVLRAIAESSTLVSMGELESRLAPMDKSSVFRVLQLFLSKHLLHALDDGTGIQKYELCRGNEPGRCSADDIHVHFHCLRCGETFCFEDNPVPPVPMPEGFEVTTINYVAKGVCPKCKHK